MATIYSRIGGEPALNAASDLLYNKISETRSLNRFFEDVDLAAQKIKMKNFLILLLTGRAERSEEKMHDSHAHLIERGLDDSHFDTVGLLLKETLEELDVPGHFIGQILEAVEVLRDPVLGR